MLLLNLFLLLQVLKECCRLLDLQDMAKLGRSRAGWLSLGSTRRLHQPSCTTQRHLASKTPVGNVCAHTCNVVSCRS